MTSQNKMATIKARNEIKRQECVLRSLFIANGSYGINQNSNDVPHLLEAINMMRTCTRLNVKVVQDFLDKTFKENFGEHYGKNGSTYDAKAFFAVEFDKIQKKFVCEFFAKCQNCDQFNECDVCDVFDVDLDEVFEGEAVCSGCYCDACEGKCVAEETECCENCHREVEIGCGNHPNSESITNGFCDDCYCEDCEEFCKKDVVNCKSCGVKTQVGCAEDAEILFPKVDDGCSFCKNPKTKMFAFRG